MYIFTNEEDLSALKTLSVCMYLCMYMHVCIWIILMHNKFFYHNKVEANIVRCPDPIIAEKMIQRIDEIRSPFLRDKCHVYIQYIYDCLMYVCMCVPGGVGTV